MTKHDAGGPAFPFDVGIGKGERASCEGMTLWDYFAAHAPIHVYMMSIDGGNRRAAEECAFFADAMIAERKKRVRGPGQ